MKLFGRIVAAFSLLIFTIGLFVFLVNISESMVKTKLCVDLGKNSYSHLICDLKGSYLDLLETTFEIGETTRVDVRTLLDEYWVASRQAGSGMMSDIYQFNVRFLGPPAVFTFDDNDVLMELRVGD